MNNPTKRLILTVNDIGLCFLTVWLSFYLRLGDFVSFLDTSPWNPLAAAFISSFIAVSVFLSMGCYRLLIRHADWQTLRQLTYAGAVYGVLFAVVITGFGVSGIPRTIGLIQPSLFLILVFASRLAGRFILDSLTYSHDKPARVTRILIYGAGATGRQLQVAIERSSQVRVVGFLDDDLALKGRSLGGVLIYSPTDISTLVRKKKADSVVLAIPGINRKRRKEIIELVLNAGVSVKTVPHLSTFTAGEIGFSALADPDIDDLLGRDRVSANPDLLKKNIDDRVVLVTGAGGSIGSELCRQILTCCPRVLLLVDQNEFSLYKIHQELSAFIETSDSGAEIAIIPLLGSVRDFARMDEIFSQWSPATVFHAAAYKHVPLVEYNVKEGVKTNIFGTLTLVKLSRKHNVRNFVLVSTDKAVRPPNMMGATKRIAELILQAFSAFDAQTQFVAVRFGNVLGSSGSVVPLFWEQIRRGGPITLTHPDVTRYFMTVSEAAELVIQASSIARQGDVVLLDMGNPVRIQDLARRMVRLSGHSVRDLENPSGDIEIRIVGLRPAEKLTEELLIDGSPEKTPHPKILRASESCMTWRDLEVKLQALEEAIGRGVDPRAIHRLIADILPDYTGADHVVDWTQPPDDKAIN